MTVVDPGLFDRVQAAVGARYRIDRQVAVSPHRILYTATDRSLRRLVSLRVNVADDPLSRDWFFREAEALAQLDHPAIRHLYDLGQADGLAWRIGNWLEGEGLDTAVRRGGRPIPQVHVLLRALLGALEHAHSHGIIVRRILPSSLIVGPSGRGTLTDLRFSSFALDSIPAEEGVTGIPYMAPEVRAGAVGDPTSDVYTASAVLYFALTATEPAADREALVPPTAIRSAIPQLFDRLLFRGMDPDPAKRFPTAWEMHDDFVSLAGEVASQASFIGPPGYADSEDPVAWERRLRRALGDDYELLGGLGRGGFGRIYRVRDLHLEREVALKILEPALTQDPETVERFRREAQIAARLHHPHVVDIFDIGGRYGLIWYSMELVDGPNLAQLVEQQGTLSPERVVRHLQEALSALAEAHNLGMVHRDLKPENMLISPDQELRITDFGLALALRGSGTGGASSRSGTPAFASPEQLLGEPVDGRSDLYSLAACAWFALLGQPPFAARTTHQILARQTTDMLPPLTRARSDVSPELEAVLRKALRADPAERWASAEAFAAALEGMSPAGSRTRERSWQSWLLGRGKGPRSGPSA